MTMNSEFTEDRCRPKDHTYPILKPDIFIEESDCIQAVQPKAGTMWFRTPADSGP